MGRSSRFLAFLCVAALGATSAAAQGRVGGGRVPGLLAPGGAVNPGVNPGVNRGVMPNVRPNVIPGVRPNVRPNVRPGVNPNVRSGLYGRRFGLDGRRAGGRFGGGDLDAAGLGLGLGNDYPGFPGDQEPDARGYGEDGGGGGAYPRIFPVDAPVCPHPLIISIGRGLRHPAHTRVVYGARPACVP